jgi:Leucine-rich repeat (LRR) protein
MNDILENGHKLSLQPINSTRQSWNSEFLGDLTPYHDIIGDLVQLQVMNLISILTDKRSTDESSSHIVMIVGCRGTGKTTLARKVFDDPRTRDAFSLALWVRGSKDFTDMDLLFAIASASGIKAGQGGSGSREKVEQMLASVLEGKRILLVIDDVWSHQIHGGYLETCLPVQQGSRILMTAGDASVAEHLNSAHIHEVKELPFSDCWTLLSRSACLDEKRLDTSMKGIGVTLIQKYGKVPLALKVIGGVLGMKGRKYEEWKKVTECEGWPSADFPDGMKDVAGPIRMAYNDLPSHLKQCLLYCLHLPEDSTISKPNVTQLWISEGFIEEQEYCSPEDTAAEYYEELVLRNLLEPEIGSPGMERCRVHDCVRTVLRVLTRDLWTGENCRASSSTTIQEMATVSCFRTVILYKNTLGDRVLGQVFKSIKHLRVLDLSNHRIRHIPGSLESLVHLRFLNLSYTDITTLPESIGSLKNLQFLVLQWCYRFHSLPDGISKLHNLRTLDLEGTSPFVVQPGLAGLVQLTKLQGFIVNSKAASTSTEKDTSGWPLGDLIHLNSLRSLQIVKIDRIHKEYLSLQRPLLLSRKSYLTQLELCGSKVHEVAEEEAKRLNDVLNGLRPPQCLESLKIVSFNGQMFPNWIQNLPNLRRLVIADCKFCEWLPALGQLPQLKTLEVSCCSTLRTIQRGEAGPTQAFPKLEQLHLDDMESLKSWEGFEDGDLPSLVKVHLARCKRLRSLPSCLRQSMLLTSIHIISAQDIKAIVDSFSNLKKLFVQDSKNLCISNLPSLEDLTVVDCSGLQDVSGLRHLKHLRIEDAELTSLPDWLGKQGSTPETLAVLGKEELLRSLVPGGKDWPAISAIGKVYGYLLDGSPFFTYSKITNELETFGNRKLDVSSVAVHHHQSKNWSPKIRKAVPSAVVLVAISLVPFLLPTRYMDFVPNTVYFFFLAYMVMLVAFICVLRTL